MSRLLEEYGREQAREGKQETKIQIATRMIVDNIPLEEIAEYVDIPLDRVEELARKINSDVDEHTRDVVVIKKAGMVFSKGSSKVLCFSRNTRWVPVSHATEK